MENKSLIPTEKIDRAILIIRGHKVMLDSDLAEIYGVKTSRLNEQVKRNKDRFPEDFMFQLTSNEKQEVIANCDHLEKLKFSRTNPYAFTEHGTIMLANVLNTSTAIETHKIVNQIKTNYLLHSACTKTQYFEVLSQKTSSSRLAKFRNTGVYYCK